jgi:hypothetical protein
MVNDVGWSVRAEDDFGEVHLDPTRAALDDLVNYVTSTGGYLVVKRADLSRDHFAQVVLEGSGGRDLWAVEVREGTRCSRAVVDEVVTAQRALRAWAFRDSDWRAALRWVESTDEEPAQ